MNSDNYSRLLTAAQGGLEVLDVLIETLHLEPLKQDPRIMKLRAVLAEIAAEEALHKASMESVQCCVCKQFLPHTYYSYFSEGVELKFCCQACADRMTEMINEIVFKPRPIDTLAQDQKELPAEYAEIVSKNFWELV